MHLFAWRRCLSPPCNGRGAATVTSPHTHTPFLTCILIILLLINHSVRTLPLSTHLLTHSLTHSLTHFNLVQWPDQLTSQLSENLQATAWERESPAVHSHSLSHTLPSDQLSSAAMAESAVVDRVHIMYSELNEVRPTSVSPHSCTHSPTHSLGLCPPRVLLELTHTHIHMYTHYSYTIHSLDLCEHRRVIRISR
jgi:hypothetical protein